MDFSTSSLLVIEPVSRTRPVTTVSTAAMRRIVGRSRLAVKSPGAARATVPLMLRATTLTLVLAVALTTPALAHGGGLNACGCHFDHQTGDCHCHRPTGCGCPCQPSSCAQLGGVGLGSREPAAPVREPDGGHEPELLAVGAAAEWSGGR